MLLEKEVFKLCKTRTTYRASWWCIGTRQLYASAPAWGSVISLNVDNLLAFCC
jgi:hypothetical protein